MARFEAETQYRGYILRLDVSETDVETENNRSKIAWALYIVNGYKNGTYYRFSANFTFSATINGTTVVSYSGNVDTTDVGSGEAHLLASNTTGWIGHNTDGSKTVSCSASCSGGGSYGPGSGSCSGKLTLTKIDRYPMLTDAPSFGDEDNPTITYTTSLGFSGATVEACIADSTGGTIYVPYRDVNVSNGSYTFNLTNEERNTLRNATPDSNTLNIRFYLKTTTTGGTEYFSYLSKQMSITNANPTISDEETETDENVITYYGTDASTIVQNASKVQCEVTATALKSASISNVSIVHNGVTYPTTLSDSKYVATIPMVANNFVINVVDSRGNSSTKTVTKTMVEYTPVDFTSFTIKRVNSTSSNIRFDIEAKYSQVTLSSTPNAPVVKFKLDNGNYKTIPSSAYSIDTTNKKITISNYVAQGELVYTSAGQFTLYIEDKLTSDTDGGANAYVTKGVATFEAGEHDLQVNGTLYQADQNGQNKKEMWELVYPVGSIYISTSSTFDPNTSFGGTWQKIQDRVLLGSGTKYTLGATGGNADGIGSIFGIAGYNYGGLAGGAGQNNYCGRVAVVDGSLATTQGSMLYFNNVNGMNFMPPYKVVNIWERTA